MTKYRTLDGATFEADSDVDLIEQLRADSWTETEDIEDFMIRMSNRCDIQNGSVVRIESTELFVQDLIAGGFLKVVDDDAE